MSQGAKPLRIPAVYDSKNGKRRVENGYNTNALMHRFYGAIDIDGQTYRVKTTIQEITKTQERNIPHSYEVTKIEMLDLRPSISLEPMYKASKTRYIGLAKLLYGIEKSYASGKKNLDESQKYIPHSYEVTKIEMLDLKPSISLTPTHQVSKTRDIGLAKLLYGIEKSYDPGKKNLDESQKLQQRSKPLKNIIYETSICRLAFTKTE